MRGLPSSNQNPKGNREACGLKTGFCMTKQDGHQYDLLNGGFFSQLDADRFLGVRVSVGG